MTTPPDAFARSDVHVSHNQLVIGEGTGASHPSHVPNGLTAAAPGAAVILTGIHTGVVDVTVHLADAPPAATAEGWDEVEDVELISFTGEMRLGGLLMGLADGLPVLTPHGPGRYGMRVHARGRDIDPTAVPRVPFEFYLITVWPIETGAEARVKLGVGVAEELGLPDKAAGAPPDVGSELRRWAAEHARPEHERGRLAGQVWVPPRPVPVRAAVRAREHRLRVVNPYQPPAAEPAPPRGLVAAVPDAVVIRTLTARGVVGVHVNWMPSTPRAPASGWEEFEEIEFVTTTGVMMIEGMTADDGEPPNLTYQGAGRYGLHVHGRTRRGERLSNRPGESYLLVVWPIALGARVQPEGGEISQ